MKLIGMDLIDRQGARDGHEQDAGAGNVAGLEELRHALVLALLAARLDCERVQNQFDGPGEDNLDALVAQGRLCAAVSDLERVDDLLHEARLRTSPLR